MLPPINYQRIAQKFNELVVTALSCSMHCDVLVAGSVFICVSTFGGEVNNLVANYNKVLSQSKYRHKLFRHIKVL